MTTKPQTETAEQSVALTPEETKARNRRNLWIALSIAAFVVLVFLITMSKLQAGLIAGAS